jgi:DNA-directed RNA polymerase delta subunit
VVVGRGCEGDILIHTVLDACQFVLETHGNPESPYCLSSLMIEMKLWKASEQKIRTALERDIAQFGNESRFVRVTEDEYALRSWNTRKQSAPR